MTRVENEKNDQNIKKANKNQKKRGLEAARLFYSEMTGLGRSLRATQRAEMLVYISPPRRAAARTPESEAPLGPVGLGQASEGLENRLANLITMRASVLRLHATATGCGRAVGASTKPPRRVKFPTGVSRANVQRGHATAKARKLALDKSRAGARRPHAAANAVVLASVESHANAPNSICFKNMVLLEWQPGIR